MTVKYFLVASMVLMPSFVLAEMRSTSYVLNENVNHVFSGPIITNVNHGVIGVNVVVTFNTNVVADGFVVYDTNSSFSNSKEQGTSFKSGTSHSVSLTGLSGNTTYYYRIRSERINGGVTTDMTARSFTTGAAPIIASSTTRTTSGGSTLIIDKTDKVAPVITNVQINIVDDSSLKMTWDTNEDSTSFGQYGETIQYGDVDGQWDVLKNHSVILKNLKPESKYHIRAVSSDSWGNIGYGEDIIFNTVKGVVTEDTVIPEVASTTSAVDNKNILTEVNRRMTEFINKIFPQISLDNKTNVNEITTIEQLTRLMSAPVLSGVPLVEVGADNATVNWLTNIDASSQVAIASDDEYKLRSGEKYVQVVGDVQILNTIHSVRVFGLKPNTVYHYQLRSKANFGPMAFSKDYTFRTLNEELKITSFMTQVKDAQTAVVKWVTNKPSDSAIQFAPYHDNVIAFDEAKTVRSTEQGLIHEIEIVEFSAGVYYDIEIISADSKGNVARQKIDRFSTQEHDLPPEIDHIKTDSTIYVDKNNKTQTVISWTTNEPTNAQIFYQEGVHGAGSKLTESTEVNKNFTKEHIFVVTKFKSGTVYSFQVRAIDSGGNTVDSKIHTFMTAKNKESIIQVIIKILEDTFGWTKKLLGN